LRARTGLDRGVARGGGGFCTASGVWGVMRACVRACSISAVCALYVQILCLRLGVVARTEEEAYRLHRAGISSVLVLVLGQ